MPEYEASGGPWTFTLPSPPGITSFNLSFPDLPAAPVGSHWQIVSFRAVGSGHPDGFHQSTIGSLVVYTVNPFPLPISFPIEMSKISDPYPGPTAFSGSGLCTQPDILCDWPIAAVGAQVGTGFYDVAHPPSVTVTHFYATFQLVSWACHTPPQKRYRCMNCQCVEDPLGPYASIEECRANCCKSGGGGGGPGDGGADILHWKRGYHIAAVEGGNRLTHSRSWHSDQKLDYTSAIDTGDSIAEPKLSHLEYQPPLGVVYRKGSGTNAAIYRKQSYDYGETWRSDPVDGSAIVQGVNGVKHAVEIWNTRTGERCLFYQDGSHHGDDGQPDGKGIIMVEIAGPETVDATGRLKGQGTFAVSPILADDSSFGAHYIQHPTRALDCVFMSGQVRKVFRSYDDGRTWFEWT